MWHYSFTQFIHPCPTYLVSMLFWDTIFLSFHDTSLTQCSHYFVPPQFSTGGPFFHLSFYMVYTRVVLHSTLLHTLCTALFCTHSLYFFWGTSTATYILMSPTIPLELFSLSPKLQARISYCMEDSSAWTVKSCLRYNILSMNFSPHFLIDRHSEFSFLQPFILSNT